MEYILQNTDIFDEELGPKFSDVLKADSFINGTVYRLKVSFHVNLLNAHTRIKEFNISVPNKTSDGTIKDEVYKVLRFQLKSLEQILKQNGIEVYSSIIQGDNLDAEDIIKIEICEVSESRFVGKGKNKSQINKCSSIMPNSQYIQETITKITAEKLSKIFYIIMDSIGAKQMCELLNIDDEKMLSKAFLEQYGDLGFGNNKRQDKLFEQLKEKLLLIADRYEDIEGEV